MPCSTTDTLKQTRPPQAEDARRLFGAVLEGWASDVLRLRAKGLDRPSRRSGTGSGVFAPRRVTLVGPEVPVGAPRRPRWAA